jgi:DNA transformation protein
MSKNSGFYEYVMEDVLEEFSGITSKRMFGGFGFYKDGVIFGIIAEGKLYFKVGESNQKDYEAFGSAPFTFPMKNGKTTTISYWELPQQVMEDKALLAAWIEKSLQESISSKKKK